MNFGLIEALEKALVKPAAELNELLRGITEEQRKTNELLTQLVASKPKPPAAKPTATKP